MSHIRDILATEFHSKLYDDLTPEEQARIERAEDRIMRSTAFRPNLRTPRGQSTAEFRRQEREKWAKERKE